jgi:hypothetical protein
VQDLRVDHDARPADGGALLLELGGGGAVGEGAADELRRAALLASWLPHLIIIQSSVIIIKSSVIIIKEADESRRAALLASWLPHLIIIQSSVIIIKSSVIIIKEADELRRAALLASWLPHLIIIKSSVIIIKSSVIIIKEADELRRAALLASWLPYHVGEARAAGHAVVHHVARLVYDIRVELLGIAAGRHHRPPDKRVKPHAKKCALSEAKRKCLPSTLAR